MASSNNLDKLRQTKAPPVLTIVGISLLVIAIAAGGFVVFNGGFKTASQVDEDYKHNLLPIIAARKGDMAPLEAENKLRKEHGQAPLELPAETGKKTGGGGKQTLQDLQKKLGATQ